MKTICVALSFAFLIMTVSAQGAEVQNCDDLMGRVVEQAIELAPTLLARTETSILRELTKDPQKESYDAATLAKLEGALRKLQCIKQKLPTLTYICTNKDTYKYAAKTMPLVGTKVKLSNFFFEFGQIKMAAMMIHEASHKCGTNDSFQESTASLREVQNRQYQNTGATYELWAENFCVPGYSCH